MWMHFKCWRCMHITKHYTMADTHRYPGMVRFKKTCSECCREVVDTLTVKEYKKLVDNGGNYESR